MVSSKRKGTNFENYVKRKLLELGYVVFRCAASKPIDLIAVKDGSVVLVECKAFENPPKSSWSKLLELAQRCGAKALKVYKKRGKVVLEWV